MNHLPHHLSGLNATGIQQDEPVAQYEIGPLKNFVYLLLDWKTRSAAIIDPQKDLSLIFKDLRAFDFRLTQILITHSHPDHTAGLAELIQRDSDIPIFTHTDDLHRFDSTLRRSGNFNVLQDGAAIEVGTLRVEVIHTPGHSAGECCFLVKTEVLYLFTGDTLFIRDCGRTDLPTGSTSEMFSSLQKIKKLSANTVILPGHHYQAECATTLEQELVENPSLLCKSVTELAALP